MAARMARLGLMAILMAMPALAQHGDPSPARTAPAEAKQFAFLIGQFDLVVHPPATGLAAKIHGVPKLVGTWKGWRVMDGYGVEDEIRITDESGNPRTLSHAVRYYDGTAKRWQTHTIDVFRGLMSQSTGEWKDDAIVTTSHGTDADGKVYALRARFSDITPTSFKFRQERSYDEGKTWDDGVLTIEAKRVAATASR